jgi:predicted adenylyl cyclase CyaB
MLEREVKINMGCKKLKQLTSILGTPNYFQQTNIIYDLPEGFLRLRKEKNNTVITYKSERINDKFGSREELEFELEENQFPIIRQIFEMMGLKETLHFNKKRAEYKTDYSKLFIDHMPTGIYLEIEAESDEYITHTMKKLGFDEKDIEKKSYFELMQNYNSTKPLNNP